jgi:hypothetical protein
VILYPQNLATSMPKFPLKQSNLGSLEESTEIFQEPVHKSRAAQEMHKTRAAKPYIDYGGPRRRRKHWCQRHLLKWHFQIIVSALSTYSSRDPVGFILSKRASARVFHLYRGYVHDTREPQRKVETQHPDGEPGKV